MGTNFYFKLDNREKIKQAVDNNDFDLARELMDDCEIHLAKTSCGWLPLFQAHPGKFESVAEMKVFYETTPGVTIIDEYDDEYTWEAFDDRVLKFNGGIYGVAPREKIEQDPTSFWYDPNMPDTGPISHFEYKMGCYAKDYYTDPEGYEFTRHEFS